LAAPLVLVTVPDGAGSDEPEIERLAYEVVRHDLQHVASIHDGSAAVTIHSGDPAAAIVATALSFEQPCVVMSSHARTGLRRRLLGSVACKVVHDAPCPVIVVPANRALAADWDLVRGLVPLDGLNHAEHALDAVRDQFGADIDLHLIGLVERLIRRSGLVTRRYYRVARDAITKYLNEVAQRLAERGCRVSRDVRVGIPEEEIAEAARACDASLIALATHGRAGFGRLVFGSTAARRLYDAGLGAGSSSA
jgi:nucleotide-binding universal stress UspA family protein